MENLYLNNLEGQLNVTQYLEDISSMSYMDPSYNTPMENFKDETDYSYGNMSSQSSYNDLQNHSNFSNMMMDSPSQTNYSTDHTLSHFEIDHLLDNNQSHLYPNDQNKSFFTNSLIQSHLYPIDQNSPLFTNQMDSSYSNSSFSTPSSEKSLPLNNLHNIYGDNSNYEKSLPINNLNNIYSDNSNSLSPYYDSMSTLESPHDQLVPNMATSEYLSSYDTTSQMGSFMNDTLSPSPSSSSMTTAQLVTKVYGRASDKQTPQERVPIVWHFLLRLLANPQYNPSIICWDNIGENTFRLINPDAVASLWGERLGKPNLTRNNFARTLRYHYSNGALNQMSEQHVYQLGKKALDYLREKARYCK